VTDMIEDASIDVDYVDDPKMSIAFLTLEGDFADTFRAYLADEDSEKVTLRLLDRSVADKLLKELEDICRS
jgi:hypothetical protein